VSKVKSVTSRTTEIGSLDEFLQLPAIQRLMRQIGKTSLDTGQSYIKGAESLVLLRRQVESHEKMLGLNWYQFARQCLGIEKNRRGILLRLMAAKDRRAQEAIVRRYLDTVNARADKSRTKKREMAKRDRRMPQWKKDFISWVRKAPKAEAEMAWEYVNKTFARPD
jgi:hypothetical protein